MWVIEEEVRNEGFLCICGVDEAGRGPLAGPVYAAAVILPFRINIAGINDSKKLSENKRDELFVKITESSEAYSIASASHEEVDELNIQNATFLAMNRAINTLTIEPSIALIDGNRNSGIRISSRCIIGGDGKSASIAAASILAKVSRDRYMIDMAEKYPQYGFENHKGYGTKLHYERLREYGLSAIHRVSFLKRLH